MRTREVDTLLRRANPVPPSAVGGAALTRADAQLRASILGGSERLVAEKFQRGAYLASVPLPRAPLGSLPSWRRPMTRAVAVAAAITVLAGGTAVVGSVLVRPPASVSPAAEQLAGSSPLLLVSAPGWTVSYVDQYVQYAADTGEMRFSSGATQVTLSWRPADTHQRYLDDRAASAAPEKVSFGGHSATLFTYLPGADYTAMWRSGRFSLELRGSFASEQDYLDVADTVRPVDEQTWLGALPASAVTPADRAGAVDAMLADIPVPVGLDVDALRVSDRVSDRYQLGAQVTGFVACGWISAWQQARAANDPVAAQHADDALVSSHSWPVLIEMGGQGGGGYPDTVWQYVDVLTTPTADPAAIEQVLAGYRQGLGCPS